MSFIVNIGGNMSNKRNRIELSKKIRADYREKYIKDLLEHIKQGLINKNNAFKEYVIECYNKGVYRCTLSLDIDIKFINHIKLADDEYTSIKDMFLENQYKAFLATINNFIIEEFNLEGCIDFISSDIKINEEDFSEEFTSINEYLHTEIIFKD
jgi:hypothetical protein